MKTTLSLIAVTVLATVGCASTESHQNYVEAQSKANSQYYEWLKSRPEQKPLFKLTGNGGPITGILSLEVNMPITPNADGLGAIPVIQQQRPSEWAGVISQGLGVLGTLGGVAIGARGAVGLANAVGNASTAGYKYVQAPGPGIVPQANITTATTTTGSNNADSHNSSANTSTYTSTTNQNPTTNTVTSTTTAPVTTTTSRNCYGIGSTGVGATTSPGDTGTGGTC